MRHRRYRIALLLGAAAAIIAAPLGHARQTTPAPTPTPATRPTIITPGIDRFSLPASGTQTQQTPPPVPRATSTPTPAAAPQVVAPPGRATQQPAARSTPAPPPVRTTPTPTARATPTLVPTQVPQQASPTRVPAVLPSSAPAVAATPAPAPAEQPAGGIPWLWIALGALAIGALGWTLGRRGSRAHEAETAASIVPQAASPPPPAPAPPVRPSPAAPPLRPVMAPPPARPPDPIAVEFRPLHIDVGDQGAVLEFELALLNNSGASADGLRVSLVIASANPQQDALIAGFHNAPSVAAAGPPVDLPPGQGGRFPGQLAIEADRIHIVQVGGRPMFVPIVMIDLRWRGGLSIRRHGADFMVGTAGQNGKLGPIWLDRGVARQGGLAATRYLSQARPVAA